MRPKRVEWHNEHGSGPTFQIVQHLLIYLPMRTHREENQIMDIVKRLPHGSIDSRRRNRGVLADGRL